MRALTSFPEPPEDVCGGARVGRGWGWPRGGQEASNNLAVPLNVAVRNFCVRLLTHLIVTSNSEKGFQCRRGSDQVLVLRVSVRNSLWVWLSGRLSTLISETRPKYVYVHSRVCVLVTGGFQNANEVVTGARVTEVWTG